MPDTFSNPGATVGSVRILLRLEGAALLAAATAAYALLEPSWLMFVLLFMAPDVSFTGYLLGPRAGAVIYNAVHTTALPLLLAIGAQLLHQPMVSAIACIWLAHIGLDRAIGFGLKYPSSFKNTHLGRL